MQQQVWDLRSQGIYGVTPGVSVWVPDWVHAPYASEWRDRSGLNQVPDTGMKPSMEANVSMLPATDACAGVQMGAWLLAKIKVD